MRRIIGITGLANSGKDTTADYIISKDSKFKKISFADPLKKMVINHFGLTYNDVYTTQGKNNFNQFWGMTNREILQKVGTDAMRRGFAFDVWVKLTQLVLKNNIEQDYIVADVRFDNQAEMIKRNNGIVIKIIRQNFKISQCTHESQKQIDLNLIDYVLYNDDTIDSLYCKIDSMLKQKGI